MTNNIKKIAGLNPSDSNPYSTIKDSSVNVMGLNQDCNSLVNGNPWRNPYSNPYVYDAATAVALVGYGPYAAGYSPHMDLAGRRKNATRETTATLKAWLYEHRKNPYPTKSEKVYLAIMTKMTLTQVSTWFANARRRLKKENKMTWSPRNRTTDDDDDRHGLGSNSDQSDDESICPTTQTTNSSSIQQHHQQQSLHPPPPPPPPPLPLTTTTGPTSFLSNIHYLSNPLSIIQHHNSQQQNIHTDEINRKRKFDENEIQERKKPCGIWSLADMAEKNHNNKINQSAIDKQQETRSYSISSSSSSSRTPSPSSSPTSPQEKVQTIVGAFKPFK
ncbi:unnamed protein product [Rotaria socialis]|uniref:Homeobox domain-containing protein n=2 Tax=Rotaria socialis TaxID=392032 RepID=A0A818C4H6_9BILA|nr:unnamed protein product [Rotaria socialis]CAF3418764.1 unnamed protein product [Rotaria socialis]CAF3465697.1 unnamed protein product [Rotaria socialis]CAF3761050.1 unnamed protein product [Rotaria socialis]